MNLLTSLLLNPPTLVAASRRAYKAPSAEVYRTVMEEKGPLSVWAIAKLLPDKTKNAVGRCLADTLEPRGYVQRTEKLHGKQRVTMYEWVGE